MSIKPIYQNDSNGFSLSGQQSELSSAKDLPIDHNIRAKLPKGAEIVSTVLLETSSWTTTLRLHVRFPSGVESQYFLKSAPNDHGRVLMEGEFSAMKELYKWAPDLVPEPHSFGECSMFAAPSTYFFLSQYVSMSDTMPDPDRLCMELAKLHRGSVSPNGHFGFHTNTCQGRIAQSVGWEANWTMLFTKMLQHVIKLDFEINGYWEDMDKLETRLMDCVVPRLLSVLQNEGRCIKPSLIHGDLWEGNVGTCKKTGNIIFYDAAAFYAHNEMEIGNWRCKYNKIANPVYTKTYLKYVTPDEPASEWEDRNRLYSVYYNIIYSANHAASGVAVRQWAFNDMHFLVDKFAPFPGSDGPGAIPKNKMAKLSAERDHTLVEDEV